MSDTCIVWEKNTVSVSTNPKVAFALSMDTRTCHFHRTVNIARGKKIRSILTQTPIYLFAVTMDTRTCHFHRTVGYLENGYRKIRMSNRMMMVMRRMMIIMILIMIIIMMMMGMMTRHCEGAVA